MKLKPVTQSDGTTYGVRFDCPGCGESHVIPTTGPKAWQFNGDFERPTLYPDVWAYPAPLGDGVRQLQPRCHSQVNDGRITFFVDSEHALAGATVEMGEMPDGAA